jgi:hypothetical protein
VLDKPLTYFDHCNFRHGQPKSKTESGAKHFVHQYSDVLRIVL